MLNEPMGGGALEIGAWMNDPGSGGALALGGIEIWPISGTPLSAGAVMGAVGGGTTTMGPSA
ncbi:hypothetical protein [Prosthecobacter sp.]|uniref:hypothetical protein n=1 Tax=Prosthecobacter sp. TaxID=1965333 RepID=UPI002489C4B9|nr:hypothetical protein [Prosthecobacter sp.]MDI1313227.1 hypothetical protein [Prosthecobacter sp.]